MDLSGKIKNWEDAQIAKLNPDVQLPDLPITVVHLSGVKGSNYHPCRILFRKAERRVEVGALHPIGRWARRRIAATRYGGKVSATPRATAGYVELTYAKRNDLGYGSVQNAAGQFVRPTSEGIAADLRGRRKDAMPADLGASLVDAPGKESYPLQRASPGSTCRQAGDAPADPRAERFLDWGAW